MSCRISATSTYKSLLEPLIEQAQHQAQRKAIVMILADGSREIFSAEDLYQDAIAYGNALQRLGLKPGDIVLLALDHCRFLISALWGTLFAGAVPAVLPYLTQKMLPAVYRERLRLMVDYCDAKGIVTLPHFKEKMAGILRATGCRVISSDDLQNLLPESTVPERGYYTSGNQTAVLQFSSGTTGTQKAVTFSHRAILDQTSAIGTVCRFSADDVIVTWAPLFHDMGLVAALMLSITARTPLVLLSPFAWIRNPRILIDAIDEFRGTVSFMPNFAFNHCVNGIRDEDLAGLDLSCCRLMVNGGEPVLFESLQNFAAKFSPCGFRSSALGAAYGATENSSSVTITPVGRPPAVDWVDRERLQQFQQAVPTQPQSRGSVAIVSCGCPLPGIKLKIVDEHDRELSERWVGEIITRAATTAGDYFRRPDLSQQAIRNGWYHSGDLGYLADGQLYLCGRKSDVIIIGGKNIYPHDIEQIVHQTPGVKAGRAAAFGMPDQRLGTEKLVIVAELREALNPEKAKAMELDIRRNVSRQAGVAVGDLQLVTGRWVVKSSSGKIARASNRTKYEQLIRVSR